MVGNELGFVTAARNSIENQANSNRKKAKQHQTG
jgi:hypothetical protein